MKIKGTFEADIINDGPTPPPTEPPTEPPFWDVPPADHTIEVDWRQEPNRVIEPFTTFNEYFYCHAPSPWMQITDGGLMFGVDPNQNLDDQNLPSWVEKRSEYKDVSRVAPDEGDIILDCFELVPLTIPTLDEPITIYQSFRKNLDGPELQIELTGKDQFNDVGPNNIVIHVNGQEWVRFNRQLSETNDFVIGIEHIMGGRFIVIHNGETLLEGTGDFVPDPAQTTTQTGLYNLGNTFAMSLMHTKDAKYTYKQQLRSFDRLKR